MSAYLYHQAFNTTILKPRLTYQDYKTAFYKKLESTTDPLKDNTYQKWLDTFVNDKNPFILDGVEVNRFRVGLVALQLGEEFKIENQTWKIPGGFFRTDVCPTVIAELRGLISVSKEVVQECLS